MCLFLKETEKFTRREKYVGLLIQQHFCCDTAVAGMCVWWNVVLEKHGEDQLDRSYKKWRSIT
jgi:hypothetical protein